MKRSLFLIAFIFSLFTTGASATLMSASYSGTVTGALFNQQPLNDFPVGTAVSWQFTFDDSFRTLNVNDDVFGLANRPANGSAQVGGDSIVLNFMRLYSYTSSMGNIISFRWQVEGTGPTIGNGGEFFGVWLTLDPSLNMIDSPVIGYGYTTEYEWGSVTSYGYLETAGTFNIRQAGEVPLPGTLWLMLPALVWLGRPRHVLALLARLR